MTLSLRRGAEILYSLALAHARRAGADGRYPLSDYALLSNARRNLGLFQHHDAITGTAKEAVAVDYGVRCVWGPGHPRSLSLSGADGFRAGRMASYGDAVGRSSLSWGDGEGVGAMLVVLGRSLCLCPGCSIPSPTSSVSSSMLRTTLCWGTRTRTTTTLLHHSLEW